MLKRLTVFLTIILLVSKAGAQTDSAYVISQSQFAEKIAADGKYDSALLIYNKLNSDLQKSKTIFHGVQSQLLINTGDLYLKKANPEKAQNYYNQALAIAREFDVAVQKTNALSAVMLLHQEIARQNWSFRYPAVKETEEEYVHFTISTASRNKDSVDIMIIAGKLDGIVDSVQTGEIYIHAVNNDTGSHKDIGFYGKVRLIKLADNNCWLRTAYQKGIDLIPGDLVILKANIPVAWREAFFRSFLMQSISLVSNYRYPLYTYRYFYYYANPRLEADVLDAMKFCVKEVVEMLAEDTLTDPLSNIHCDEGAFAGKNLFAAMDQSKPEHFRYFLNFVYEFPGKYEGNNYKFSETYATWLINNTPFAKKDLRPHFLGFKTGAARQAEMKNFTRQLQAGNLISQWVDEGLGQVQTENAREAMSTVSVLADAAATEEKDFNSGWSYLLHAGLEKKLMHDSAAVNLLDQAEVSFRKGKNEEGISWVKNMKENWKQSGRVKVGVQAGHLFTYTIAISPNPRFIATGGIDHLVKIWDMNLGKEILTLNDNKDEINSLHFSPNGRYLVSTAADSTIAVWNTFTWTLMYRIQAGTILNTAIVSDDNESLITGGEDSLILFRDLKTGKVTRKFKEKFAAVKDLCLAGDFLFSACADSMVHKWDLSSGEATRWYRHQGKALSVKVSSDFKNMSVVSTDSVLTIWDLTTNKKKYKTKISVTHPGNITWFGEESFSPDGKAFAYPDTRKSFIVLDLRDLYARSYPTLNSDYNLADLQFSADGQSLYARFELGGPLRIYNFAGWDIRNKTTISWKDIRFYANMPIAVQFSSDDNKLFVMHNEVSSIDLRTGTKERLLYSTALIKNKYLTLAGDSLGTVMGIVSPYLELVRLKTGETVKRFELPARETISALEISPNNQYCFMGSENGMIRGWDIASGKEMFSVLTGENEFHKINVLHFDAHHGRLLAISDEGIMYVYNPQTGDTIRSIRGFRLTDMTASADFIYTSTWDGHLLKWHARDFTLIHDVILDKDGLPAGQVLISPDGRILVVQSSAEAITGMRTSDDVVLYKVPDHDFGGSMLAFNHGGSLLATGGFDSKVNLFNPATGEKLVSVFMPLDKDLLIADEQGHYLASRSALDAVLLTYNNNAYNFDQFDLQLNRPDLVLKKIGRADTALLRSYELAYRKRLQKMKLDPQQVTAKMHLPQVRIDDKYAVHTITTEKNYSLRVECNDSRYPLRSLQVLVNNNPVYGVNGKPLEAAAGQTLVIPVDIPLSEGDNLVKVYCTNNLGIQSLQESFSVLSKYKPAVEPQVYFFGIAVSGYRDPRMTLDYPAKDIRDMAKALKTIYPDIKIDTLINKKAVRENILALKNKLQQTTINDKVILAVNGHGLLSDSLDFYFGTWDVDPMKPAGRGVKYDDLENLLSGIPARKKLMLIDACHSGAIDKDEILALNSDTAQQRIISRAGESNVKQITPREKMLLMKQARISANSSFEMMQQLFTDLSGNNGSVVISAAGGMEYALESGQWNNGVFTYCILQGIQNKLADSETGNNDGHVSVQELLDYVSKKVPMLTKGRQRPVSRRENVEFSWNLR